MRTQLRIFATLSFILLLAVSSALAGGPWYVGTGGTNAAGHGSSSGDPFLTIQYAIGQASGTDVINIGAGLFSEAVSVPSGKSLTLDGAGASSTTITPPSGNGITVSANSVTIENLTVTGASGDGISANGVSGLTITSVNSTHNGGSGAQLTNCTGVNVSSSTFSSNTHEGFNTLGGSHYVLNTITANSNTGSGVDIDGVTATSGSPSTLTNITANSNAHHGISISDGATYVTISGTGTFNNNGTPGDAYAGINIYASGGTTTSNITVGGTVTSNNNSGAGVIVFASTSADNITNVTIGDNANRITVSGNGSTGGNHGGGGIAVAGNVATTQIRKVDFSVGTANPQAGILDVGLNNSGANPPTSTSVTGCTFTGYTSSNPFVAFDDGQSHISNNNNLTATNNTFTFRVLVRAMLQGPFLSTTGLMNTALANSLIPLIQPYGTAPYDVTRFNYGGSETTTRSVLTSNSIVDWVLIELRATSNGSAVARTAGLLKNNGNVYDVDGTTAGVLMTETQDGYDLSHYIVFKHRNHLPVMSATPASLPNTTAYDFTASSAAYENPDPALVALPSSSLFGIPDGDVDFNGGVGGTDISAVVADVGDITYSVYDIDFNGGVGGSDISDIVANVGQVVQVP
jgi:hypothetical protein